jgi:hypothetical protein
MMVVRHPFHRLDPSEDPMPRLALLALLAVSSTANAIVIRHDVDDAKYRVPASEFPALADMPGEGHGVLIAPQWILTAAHAVTWQARIDEVSLNGVPRRVERLVVHPGYRKLPQPLIDEALKTGDATRVIAWLAASDDVALLKLAQPVTDIQPATLYRGGDEAGKLVEILGKGATGNGLTGQDPHGSHRTELRRAFNTIRSVQDRWISYEFHQPPAGQPLEGASGNGDSGGPVLLQAQDRWQVAGLTSWTSGQDHAVLLHPGHYGQITYNVRVSRFVAWIEGVMAGGTAATSGPAPAPVGK